MVRFITQADYAPGSLQPLGPGLGDVLASVFSARRAAEAHQRAEGRQAALDKAKIEEAQFQRAQSDIQRQLQLRKAGIEEAQAGAAATSLAQAPRVSGIEAGLPELAPEEAGPAPSELAVPKAFETLAPVIDPQTGKTLMAESRLPLQYKEQIAGEKERERIAKGDVVRLTPELHKNLPANIQAAFAVGSTLPRETLERVETQRAGAEERKQSEEARDKRAAEAEAARDRRAAAREDALGRRAEAVAAGTAAKQTTQQEGKLRADYNHEAKKTNDNLRDLNRGLSVGTPQIPTALSDYALVYAFNKALDPTSIVRESEFKSAKAATGGIDQRAFGAIEDIRSGKLTPEKRAEMAQVVRGAQAAEQKNLEDIQAHYRDLAGVYEASPDRIFGTRATVPETKEATSEPKLVNAPPKAGEVRNGYRFKGGNPNDRNAWEKA